MTLKRSLTRWLAMLGLLLVLTACATTPRLVPHAFNFDGWNDGWQATAELLEYSYGDQYREVQGKAGNGYSAGVSTGVNGPMPVADFLYIRWRLKATGEVLENKVDLRHRLPRDMTDHALTFVIDGRQLYVFVVTPQLVTAQNKAPLLRTWLSRYHVAYEIYPALSPR
ncbi:MAG: hypothetical protein ACLGG8_09050 [Gammaproteobacteria bacterium]